MITLTTKFNNKFNHGPASPTPITQTAMTNNITKEQVIEAITKANQEITAELAGKDSSSINETMVIVSDDFTFHAVLVNNAYLTPSVIAHEAHAMRMSPSKAVGMSMKLAACHSFGRITWQPVDKWEYLERILKQNKRTLELINN